MDLSLRLPGWSPSVAVRVNGTPVDTATAVNGYLRLTRRQLAGGQLDLAVDTGPPPPRPSGRRRRPGRVALGAARSSIASMGPTTAHLTACC